MFPSPPTTHDRVQWRIWAADALQVREVTANDAPAIHDVEDAAREAGDSWRQGMLEAVLLHVRNLQEATTRQRSQSAAHSKAELDTAQESTRTAILKQLGAATGTVRPKDLASQLNVSREHATRCLARLTKDGLTDRSSAQHSDGRAVEYELTGDGREVLKLIEARPDLNATSALTMMKQQLHRLVIKDLIAGQRFDRRAEKPDAMDMTRTETALSFARKLGDANLYLQAAHEHLTSLRHRDKVGDAEEVMTFISGLRSHFPGSVSGARELELAALEKYHLERLSHMKTAPERIRLEPPSQIALLQAADAALSQTEGVTRKEIGAWIANALSKQAVDLGQSVTAATHALEAVTRAHAHSADWFTRVTVRTRLASIWRLQGNPDQAIESLTNTLRLLQTKDPGHEFDLLRAECLYQRGEARRYRRQLTYAQRDLHDAAKILERAGGNATRSRLLSFTESALLAAAYDIRQAQRLSASAPDEAAYIQGFTEMLEDNSLAPDIRALTTRRLAVALRGTDPSRAYDKARAASDIYEGVSLIGQLESLVSAAGSSHEPLSELDLVSDLFDEILNVAESPLTANPDSHAVRMIDVWTRRMIASILDRNASSSLQVKLKNQIAKLEEAGLAPHYNASRSREPEQAVGAEREPGASEMGKEPPRLAPRLVATA